MPVVAFDPELIRPEFPALRLAQDGRPVVYFDGPGGTQVPQRTIDAVVEYYRSTNANEGGAFLTSEANDAMALAAHQAVADFLGAGSPSEVKFGQNMTTLTFQVSRAIGASLKTGDEILVTALDHEANVSPWHAVAGERGLVVRTVDIRPDDITLDLEDFDRLLSPRTRVVAFGYASNAVGTINPVRALVDRAHSVGALAFVDAVHFAPHGPIDVGALDADLLVCSAYKWFGPHLGVLYGKTEVLERLARYKVRPAHDAYETGTPNFEALAGTLGTIEYLCALGAHFGDPASTAAGSARRRELVAAGRVIATYERRLAARLIAGLRSIRGARLWGIADPARIGERTPTVALTFAGMSPREAAVALGRAGVFAWDGHFYAQALIERLGLLQSGGVLRLGMVHYNTEAEVDRVLDGLDRFAGKEGSSSH